MAKRIERNIRKTDCIGVLGLSFKPGSDDVRDTPAAKVIRELAADGYGNIAAYDPVAEEEFRKHYEDIEIEYCSGLDSVIAKADELVILTAWEEFRKVPAITDKPVIDCRYML